MAELQQKKKEKRNGMGAREGTSRTNSYEGSLAHALLEPLHHHLVRRHPWATCTIFLFNRGRESECLTSCVANDVRV